MTKFIVVAGGVISGVGKGVTTAALGKIMQEHGYKTTLIKIDPYINFDAGTLRPTEHGEVWVTDDGGEIDQDLGTYERFMNTSISKKNNITTGQIYKSIIDKERAGHYLGQTVQFIPHVIDEIKQRILQASDGFEVAIIEIGGTVGDYENVPFLHAIKALEREFGGHSMAYVLVTYLPVPDHIHEMKTKPTQQAIRLLGQEGIQPDFIICRSKYTVDAVRRKKIEEFANLAPDHVISAPDIDTVYQIPLDLEAENMGTKILTHLNLTSKKQPDWRPWKQLVDAIKNPSKTIIVAIVGKYLESGDYSMTDSYVSIYQALIHAGSQLDCGIKLKWIDAKSFETNPDTLKELLEVSGIIIPGGFGQSGVEGKISAIEFARIHNIPFLGLCYGMQLAAVEFARNVCKLTDANTTEADATTKFAIVDILPYQQACLDNKDMGGSMRLGAYKATIKDNTKVHNLYTAAKALDLLDNTVSERHRHRYEVNPNFVGALQDKGLTFSGHYQREDGTQLMEFLELTDDNHPFFVATQAHPEFKSRLGNASPLFYGFVQSCIK